MRKKIKLPEEIVDVNVNYLEHFKINERKYIIGIFQEGITVYKQQIRALNIFYALYKTGVIKSQRNFTIAVIGGGVAGLTFAAAAIKSKINVVLIEKQKRFLDLHLGCDIRKIHPNLYDFPNKGCLYPYARLPLMSWRYDTANNVAKQILSEFNSIKDKNPDRIHEYLKGSFEIIKEKIKPNSKIAIEAKSNDIHNPLTKTHLCDLIIYATGYGVERDVLKTSTPSYWRNDSIGQSTVNDSKFEYLVSGVGDGGLIDTLRLAIFDFSYELIFDIMRSSPTKYNRLILDLTAIKKRLDKKKKVTRSDLGEAFSVINSSKYDYIIDLLKQRNLLRSNNIKLNCNQKQKIEIFDFRKISLLNAFLIHILLEKEIITHQSGELEYIPKSKMYTIDTQKIPKNTVVITRHGTDKNFIYNDKSLQLNITEPDEYDKIKELQKRQENSKNYGKVNRLWEFGILNKFINATESDNVAYLPTDTSALCSSFVSILAKVLLKYHAKDHSLRVSLHRVINIEDKLYFQQVCSYFGSKEAKRKGGEGRIYPVNRGNVGYSIHTTHPTLVIKDKDHEEDFNVLLRDLNVTDSPQKFSKTLSCFTLPILSKNSAKSAKNNFHSNLVVFIDSSDPHFFGSRKSGRFESSIAIDTVLSATSGFVDYVERLLKKKHIFMAGLEFDPTQINSEKYLKELNSTSLSNNTCFVNLEEFAPKLEVFSKGLIFHKYHSFDIVYNNKNSLHLL